MNRRPLLIKSHASPSCVQKFCSGSVIISCAVLLTLTASLNSSEDGGRDCGTTAAANCVRARCKSSFVWEHRGSNLHYVNDRVFQVQNRLFCTTVATFFLFFCCGTEGVFCGHVRKRQCEMLIEERSFSHGIVVSGLARTLLPGKNKSVGRDKGNLF